MTTWALWIRAETEDEAARLGREWAEAEPNLDFVGVVSVEPRIHPWEGTPLHGVWTVTVAAPERATDLTLGLSA